MKTKTVIAALVAAAAGLAVYFFIKKRNKGYEEDPVKKTHHLTEAFVRAKEYAGNH